MDNSTLPPLFDNMDNVDISSPSEEPEIFQSAIQVRNFFCFRYQFTGVKFSAHYEKLSNYSYNSSGISSRNSYLLFVRYNAHFIYAGCFSRLTC